MFQLKTRHDWEAHPFVPSRFVRMLILLAVLSTSGHLSAQEQTSPTLTATPTPTATPRLTPPPLPTDTPTPTPQPTILPSPTATVSATPTPILEPVRWYTRIEDPQAFYEPGDFIVVELAIDENTTGFAPSAYNVYVKFDTNDLSLAGFFQGDSSWGIPFVVGTPQPHPEPDSPTSRFVVSDINVNNFRPMNPLLVALEFEVKDSADRKTDLFLEVFDPDNPQQNLLGLDPDEPINQIVLPFNFDSSATSDWNLIEPTPTPSPTPTPTPTPTPSPTPSATPSPSPNPSPSETPSPTPSAAPSPTDSPTPSPTDSPTPSPTDSPIPTDTPSPSPTESPAPSPTDSPSPTPSATPSATPSPTDSPTPSPTNSPTPSATPSATPSPIPYTLRDVVNHLLGRQYIEADTNADGIIDAGDIPPVL